MNSKHVNILRILGIATIMIFSISGILINQFEAEIKYSNLIPERLKHYILYVTWPEEKIYDARMNTMFKEGHRDDRIVLAAIDDNSLKKIGRFPWSRENWVPVLKKLRKFGVKNVAFDVVFSEPQLNYIKDNGKIIRADEIFEKYLKEIKGSEFSVFLNYSLDLENNIEKIDDYFNETPEELYNFIIDAKEEGDSSLFNHRVLKATFPLKKFSRNVEALGHIGAKEDADGIFRKYHFIANNDGFYLPSLSLILFQKITNKKVELYIKKNNDAYLNIGKNRVPLNSEGEAKLRWTGGPEIYPYIGISEILEANINDQDFIKALKGKTVFIGSTSFGAHDFRHTPVSNKLPGVFLHMSALSMLIDNFFFQPKESSYKWSWIFLITTSFLMLLIARLKNPLYDITFLISTYLFIFITDYFFFMPKGYELSIFFILFSITITYAWETLIDFYLSNKDKNFLKNAFGNYISPELIDMMYEKGNRPKLGGEVRELTAFFTDIQSFSSFSEKLSVTELVELLNEYLSEMTNILLSEQGTLDKYEGDAIIAFFGAPVSLENHAECSLNVALKMQERLEELKKKWRSEGDRWPEIVHNMRHRIGINSGDIMTGNMGSETRMNYTMMGDSVNLAARLEESAKQYGIFTQVSQYTYELTKNNFVFREIDTVQVVGKEIPVTTYELLGRKDETQKTLIDLKNAFDIGLLQYKKKQWDKAILSFKKSLELEWIRFPDLKNIKTNPSMIYIERCQNYQINPPPMNWDGVTKLSSK